MANHSGNLNFESWEANGTQRIFHIGGTPEMRPASVSEGVEVHPVMRYGVDTGFRWSYDEGRNSLIVDGDPPAKGVIICCSYEPKPHVPVEGEEWTTITIERG
jgi:hypothetical protein